REIPPEHMRRVPGCEEKVHSDAVRSRVPSRAGGRIGRDEQGRTRRKPTDERNHLMTERHIIPFGGLRSVPGRTHPIVEYLLGLTGKPRARVAFLPTATGDSSEALVNLYGR